MNVISMLLLKLPAVRSEGQPFATSFFGADFGAELRAGRLSRIVVAVILNLCLSPITLLQANAVDQDEASRFTRTLLSVKRDTPDAQAQFAVVALEVLAAANAQEADYAREQMAASKEKRKLSGWAYAVERYARDLQSLAQSIESGASVTLRIDEANIYSLTVDGRMVILSHPRWQQQKVLEQEILQMFCVNYECTADSDVPSAAVLLSASAPLKPRWVFGEDGADCVFRGISIHYPPGTRLALARQQCVAFLKEVVTLVSDIAWQRKHAVSVDWKALSLFPTHARPEHRLQLNTAGDSVLLNSPLLYAAPGLLQQLSPWLRASVSGDTASVRFEASDIFAAPAS